MACLPGKGNPADGSPLSPFQHVWPVVLFAAGAGIAWLLPWALRPGTAVARVAGGTVLMLLAHHALRTFVLQPAPPTMDGQPDKRPPSPFGWWWCVPLVLLAAWFVARLPGLLPERLFADDLDYLAAAEQADRVFPYLFRPYNEHLCVFTRAVALLVVSDDRSATLQRIRWLSAALVTTAIVLLAALQWRLWRHPLVLVATAFFAWMPTYREAVNWFSASSWMFGVVVFLVAWHLVLFGPLKRNRVLLSSVLVASSLLNYTVSVVGAVVLSIYLAGMAPGTPRRWTMAPAIAACVTLLAIGLSLGGRVVREANYGGRSFAEAIDPWNALVYLGRAPGDVALHSLLWQRPKTRPFPATVAATTTVMVAWGLWYGAINASRTTAVACAAALWLFLLPYVVVVPFRSWVEYRDFLAWGRYHLWPAVGLALALATAIGFLTHWRGWVQSGSH